MKYSTISIILFLFVACSTHSLQKRFELPPDSWKPITDCMVSFYVPSDIVDKKVSGTDSCWREYQGENIYLVLDVIGGSKPNSTRKNAYLQKPDFRFEEVLITERRAEIITWREDSEWAAMSDEVKDLHYAALLYIPQIKQTNSLTIWIYCKTAAERDEAIKIFQSVEINQS